jgi:hypothetical protein
MLEVYLILDCSGTLRQYIYGSNHSDGRLHHQRMDREQIEYIKAVQEMDEKERLTKKVLNRLKAIKVSVTGQPDRECFCSQIRRKIWYKDFTNWYESNA